MQQQHNQHNESNVIIVHVMFMPLRGSYTHRPYSWQVSNKETLLATWLCGL